VSGGCVCCYPPHTLYLPPSRYCMQTESALRRASSLPSPFPPSRAAEHWLQQRPLTHLVPRYEGLRKVPLHSVEVFNVPEGAGGGGARVTPAGRPTPGASSPRPPDGQMLNSSAETASRIERASRQGASSLHDKHQPAQHGLCDGSMLLGECVPGSPQPYRSMCAAEEDPATRLWALGFILSGLF